MKDTQVVRCPNCGSKAKRHSRVSFLPVRDRYPKNQINQIECQECDYLMVICSLSGNVLEAYAPGISSQNIYTKLKRLCQI
jgi:DNA-directed RNA polymerase subunit RPC12/RpoP